MRLNEFTLFEGATHVYTCHNKRKIAFTLAEVLITLTVIGVVAAVTMSTVIAKYNEIQIVSKLQKAYFELSQAYQFFLNENGSSLSINYNNEDKIVYDEFIDKMASYYKKVVKCDNRKLPNACYEKEYYKTLLGNNFDRGYDFQAGKGSKAFVTPSGMTIGFGIDGVYLWQLILVDLNGKKGPNRFGYDTFGFSISNDKIVPNSDHGCDIVNDVDKFHMNAPNGLGCTKWVLVHKNLDYQKCIKGNSSYCSKNYSKP